MDVKKEALPAPSTQGSRANASPPAERGAFEPSSPSPTVEQHVAGRMDLDLPPSYSAPSQSLYRRQTGSMVPLSSIPATPPINFGLYRSPGVVLSKDKMTYSTDLPLYSQSAPALFELIERHAQLPPHPLIRICGMEQSGKDASWMDLRISLLPYIVRPPNAQGSAGWQYVKLIRDGEEGWRGGSKQSRTPQVKGGLEQWTRRYVMEQSKNKSFILTKQVVNWDTKYLEGQIRSLLHSVGYKGTVKITFPITHASLVVNPPSSKSWLEAMASVFKFKDTRRYEVASAIWPYAALTSEDAGGHGNAWAVKSEQQFWWEWQDAIRLAVMERRKGWVSVADQFEAAMGTQWDAQKASQASDE